MYHGRVYWWESVLMCHRLALALLYTFGSKLPMLQAMIATVMCAALTVVHAWVRPLRSRDAQALQVRPCFLGRIYRPLSPLSTSHLSHSSAVEQACIVRVRAGCLGVCASAFATYLTWVCDSVLFLPVVCRGHIVTFWSI